MPKKIILLFVLFFVVSTSTAFSNGQNSLNLTIFPEFNIPVGESNDIYYLGGGISFSGAYSLPPLPFLLLGANVNYTKVNLRDIDNDIFFLSMNLGIGVQFHVLRFLALFSTIYIGASLSSFDGTPGMLPLFKADLGTLLYLDETHEIGFGAGYQHYFYSGGIFYQGITVNLYFQLKFFHRE